MQKLTFIVLFCAVFVGLFGSITSADGPDMARLSPALRGILARAEGVDRFDLAVYAPAIQVFSGKGIIIYPRILREERGERIGVLVRTRRPVWGVRFLGLPVGLSTGTILTMRVTLADLLILAASPDVIYVEPAWRTAPKRGVSVPASGGGRAQSLPVRGENVIIGAVDTGIDYTHLDFRYDADNDGFEESSRILSIWDQTVGFFGTMYSNEDIESDIAAGFGAGEGLVRQRDTSGHGTHVMGIAAGDGSAAPAAGFVGVAPEARIIMVKTTFFTSDILAGASYIFDRAEEQGLPAVVNLSLGGHDGPHDGTSLFERALDELVGQPGRAIVVSAGNEGDKAIHVAQTLNGDSFTFYIVPSSGSLDLTMWYPGDSSFTMTVVPPGGSPLVVPTGTRKGAVATNWSISVDNALHGANPNNNDNEARIMLRDLLVFTPWEITVSDAGGGGRFDGWITRADAGMILGGDGPSLTIAEPGNAVQVITVGSFNSTSRWPSLAGDQDFSERFPVGEISNFSSRGPTRDGRQKPEIAAPGAWIISALSADSFAPLFLTHPAGVHSMNLGTSMAAPYVSGVIALIFAVDPRLTKAEIREIITTTATEDRFTGRVPNPYFGWGKVDRAAAVGAAYVYHIPGPGDRPTVILVANPVRDRAVFTFTLPEGTEQATLHVINVAGALMFEVDLEPAQTSFEWDLRTWWGEPLGSGLYLYILVTQDAKSAVGRLVIAR